MEQTLTRKNAKQAAQAILYAEHEITNSNTFHLFEDKMFPEAFKRFDDDGDGKI